MRLLHPKTIEIIAEMPDRVFKYATVSKKQILAHAWAEVFKYLKGSKSHPKMFLIPEFMGMYLSYVYGFAKQIGCKLDPKKVYTLNAALIMGWESEHLPINEIEEFDDNYLFSDAVSLYLKGVNIFPAIFGEDWRKYVPIESIDEIIRIAMKTQHKKRTTI